MLNLNTVSTAPIANEYHQYHHKYVGDPSVTQFVQAYRILIKMLHHSKRRTLNKKQRAF